MKTSFSRTLMVPGQPEIAKVDQKTGILYLSPKIWNGLPQSEKNFVLFHENGHLELQTSNEFLANKYAVGKFLSGGSFSNKELGQKIMVMRDILDKADGQTSNFTAGVNDMYGIGTGLSAIMQGLPVLGIGQKAREKEATATAAANSTILNAQAAVTAAKAKSTTTIILVAGGILIFGLIIYLTLRKK